MEKKISNNQIKKNLVISIFVQVISLIVNLLLNLILPKCIDEFQYAYWQTYFLYVGYVGVMHFGLLDGIVLRYSQYDYDQLDKPRIRSQFQLLLAINSLMTVIVMMISVLFASGANKYIFIFVAIGIISKNIYTYSSYTFQITNRISKYAILVISMRVFYGILIIILLCCKVNDFRYYCIADIISDLFGVVVASKFNKGLYFGKSLPIKEALNEFKINIASGVMLLISNWTANLLVGNAKMIIQWHWDELVFGKVSFAFSVSTFFLTFVNAISIVLFPSIKRMNTDELPSMYMSIRNIISPLLISVMIFYFPGCWALGIWLPKYADSFVYLGILMPILFFSSKVTLLTNNYLKAYRKEKVMLLINVVSVFIAFLVYSICVCIIDSLLAVLFMTVVAVMLRSVASEIIVMNIIKIEMKKDFIIEMFMTFIFMISSKFFNMYLGFAVYLVFLIIYYIIYRKNIMTFILKFRRR